LHFPPFFALRRRDRVGLNLVIFGNARRPQPDESVPASGQDVLSILARRHVCYGRIVQVQRRERRRGRLSPIGRYTEDLRRAIVRGGYDEQILVGGNRWLGWYDGEGRDGGRMQGRGVEEGLAAVEYAQCTVV
jgi:hypothetical protein